MNDDYHYQHLTPRELRDKKAILDATHDIEFSMTGRVDVMSLHSFFIEAASLLRNSVKLFEQGFFDAALYSVRTSLELARVITHFSEQDTPTESEIYKSWIHGDWFPVDNKIRKRLKQTGAIYSEVREALPDFFDSQDARLENVQKYIHKQSYKTFYAQNPFRPDVQQSRIRKANELFEDFITNSIAEIAVLRLCIDPFPLLLRDERIMYRIHFQSMTTPYSDGMIELIGTKNIDSYRGTGFYRDHLEQYSVNEELAEATYNLINSEYYDRSARESIMQQHHLLSKRHLLAIDIFELSNDITRIFLDNGLTWYFSSTKSLRKGGGSIPMDDHMRYITDNEPHGNIKIEGAFISFFPKGQDTCWIEHNQKLTQQDTEAIGIILHNHNDNERS